MANIRKAWVFSPHKPVAPKVPAQVKADLQQKARRPLKTGLITLKAETDLGVKPTSVEAGLITLRRQMQSFNPPTGRR